MTPDTAPTRAGHIVGHMLFPTSLVGSYPQPDWLIDRERLRDRFPPRVRALELWRIEPQYLDEAQDEAADGVSGEVEAVATPLIREGL